jgi:hypothetical protein
MSRDHFISPTHWYTKHTYKTVRATKLNNIPYLKDEKARIHRLLSGFPQSYQEKIEFDEPKTLEGTIRKAKYCYYQSKHRKYPLKDWKKKDNSGFQKNGFKPSQYKNPKINA